MQDSNPRLRLRRPEGYPDYPNCPIQAKSYPFLNQTLALIEVLCLSRTHMAKRLPCIQNECSACCRQTTMPITAIEASLLSRRTGMDESEFCFVDEDGIRRLLNNQSTKACVFLATNSDLVDSPGICTVYEYRPKGCQCYPYVLNDNDLAILDDLCPHKDEFDSPSEDDTLKLLNLEKKLNQ